MLGCSGCCMATLLLRQSLLQGFVNGQVNLNTTLIMFHQLIIHVLLIDLRCSKIKQPFVYLLCSDQK